MAVFPLGVKHGDGRRKLFFGQVMVTDDDVHTLGTGIADFINGLDAAVEGDDEAEAILGGPIQGLDGQSVTLIVAVRDIIVEILGEPPEEGVDQGDGGGAIDIIVTVNQDLLLAVDGFAQPFDRFVHVLHQERIVERLQAGTEKGAGLLEGFDAALDQQGGKHGIDSQFRAQTDHGFGVRHVLDLPFPIFRHIHKDNHKIPKIELMCYFCMFVKLTLKSYRIWPLSNLANRKSSAGNR